MGYNGQGGKMELQSVKIRRLQASDFFLKKHVFILETFICVYNEILSYLLSTYPFQLPIISSTCLLPNFMSFLPFY